MSSILFADDTTIYKSSLNLIEAIVSIKADLRTLNDWFFANKLSLNVAKTNFMVFNPKTGN